MSISHIVGVYAHAREKLTCFKLCLGEFCRARIKSHLESHQLLENIILLHRCEPLSDCVEYCEVVPDSLQAIGNKGLDLLWQV